MYLHAYDGFLVITTWIAEIKNGNYRSWPNISAIKRPTWAKNNLPKILATTMGHMKVVCQRTSSTQHVISKNIEIDNIKMNSEITSRTTVFVH